MTATAYQAPKYEGKLLHKLTTEELLEACKKHGVETENLDRWKQISTLKAKLSPVPVKKEEKKEAKKTGKAVSKKAAPKKSAPKKEKSSRKPSKESLEAVEKWKGNKEIEKIKGLKTSYATKAYLASKETGIKEGRIICLILDHQNDPSDSNSAIIRYSESKKLQAKAERALTGKKEEKEKKEKK